MQEESQQGTNRGLSKLHTNAPGSPILQRVSYALGYADPCRVTLTKEHRIVPRVGANSGRVTIAD